MPIRSYTRSTDCNRVSHGQNILSDIHIPVMVRPTLRTIPLSDAQRQPLNNVTTASTAFRTGKPLVHPHQGSTIPLAFVLQLPDQFPPASITDGVGELPVLDHVFHGQRLHGNRKWDKPDPTISRSWMTHWPRVIPFFAFPSEIRKAIYTTNAIESMNMTLRKALKNHRVFPTDKSAMKAIYLAIQNVSKKWTMPIRDWKPALNRFMIEFGDRLPI